MTTKEQQGLSKAIRKLPRYEPVRDDDRWRPRGPNCWPGMEQRRKGSWLEISLVLELVRNLKVMA